MRLGGKGRGRGTDHPGPPLILTLTHDAALGKSCHFANSLLETWGEITSLRESC